MIKKNWFKNCFVPKITLSWNLGFTHFEIFPLKYARWIKLFDTSDIPVKAMRQSENILLSKIKLIQIRFLQFLKHHGWRPKRNEENAENVKNVKNIENDEKRQKR